MLLKFRIKRGLGFIARDLKRMYIIHMDEAVILRFFDI